ncbi:hypothetical protein ACVWY0_002838 [Arthrobacter sp. UYNi723]
MFHHHDPGAHDERGHPHLIDPEPWGTGDPAVEEIVRGSQPLWSGCLRA